MNLDRKLKVVFDDVAEAYDEARPGYPEELIEDTIALSEIRPDGRILEIGCGPGKATLPFARRGYRMLCLELGGHLAAIAAEHCRQYPDVVIQHVSFEDWPLEERTFDLALSAQAFHWIEPEVGYPKVAAALKDGGSLALYWNHSPGGDTPFRQAVTQVHAEIAPELLEHLPGQKSTEDLIKETVAEIDASGLFGEVEVREYDWSDEYTADRYVKLLSTFGRIRALDQGVRHALLAGIHGVVERFGGSVESRNISLLYLARVKR